MVQSLDLCSFISLPLWSLPSQECRRFITFSCQWECLCSAQSDIAWFSLIALVRKLMILSYYITFALLHRSLGPWTEAQKLQSWLCHDNTFTLLFTEQERRNFPLIHPRCSQRCLYEWNLYEWNLWIKYEPLLELCLLLKRLSPEKGHINANLITRNGN